MHKLDEVVGDLVPIGTQLVTKKDSYLVTRLIYQGTFTDFYEVKNSSDKLVAVELTRKSDHRKHERLQKELLLKLSSRGRHFADMLDRTKNEEGICTCLVYELPGRRLHQLRDRQPGKVLSFATAMGVGIQCLEAVEDLHRAGYIHRDIKPHNFSIGSEGKKHCVYLVEFGLARKYKNARNEVKPPRKGLKFKGTVRFSPLSAHQGIECGPIDDCESWFYLVVSLMLPECLPWSKSFDIEEIGQWKEACRMERRHELFAGIKRSDELEKILKYIDSRNYEDRVDYDYIYRMVKQSCRIAGVDYTAPYDWEAFTFCGWK